MCCMPVRSQDTFAASAASEGRERKRTVFLSADLAEILIVPSHSLLVPSLSAAEPMQSNRHRESVRHGHKQNSEHKPTRVRTVLNEKQLNTLRTCYNANPRPDALMKEQLVEMTGLSPRVIRVWFQNKRCKDKKRMILTKQMEQQAKVSDPVSGYRTWSVGLSIRLSLRSGNGTLQERKGIVERANGSAAQFAIRERREKRREKEVSDQKESGNREDQGKEIK